MFEGMDFSKMGEMLQSVKDKAAEFEDEIAKKEFYVQAGGGLIHIKINGNLEIIDLDIDDELLSDKQSLQILLISAFNDAIKMASEEKKKAATSALGLGGFGL